MESALQRADATLEDWFRQSQVTTRQAAIVFARFLSRAKRQGAGALRHQLDDLQTGLKKLSAGLEQLERDGKAVQPSRRAASTSRQPAARRQAPRRPARTGKARKKAA
jgi:outer membrane murein-binding lipoprotein Lpp